MTLQIFDNLIQGTDEWLEARRGILTASVIGRLITPSKMQPANNDTSRALVHTLVAERITSYIEPVYVSRDMENGTFVEPYIRDFYAEHHASGAPVIEVGFMTLEIDGHRLGYSPDGLVGDDGLIELKSRKGHIQLGAFTTADYGVPKANLAQIQTGLLVSGREWCDYVAYSGDMPLYIHRVTPDPAWQDAIRAALGSFEEQARNLHNIYTRVTEGLPVADRVLNDELMNLEF